MVHDRGQWPAIAALRAVFVLGTGTLVFLLSQRSHANAFSALIATGLTLVLLLPFSEPRPHLFSFVAFATVMLICDTAPRRILWLFLLPPLFALWANIHGAVLIGFLPLFISCLLRWRQPRPWISWLVLLASALAVLLNPHGMQVYLFPLKAVGDPAIRSAIYEWAPPNFAKPFWPFIAALFLWVVSMLIPQIRRRVPLLVIITGLATAAFALVSRRQIAWFAIAAAPLFAAAISALTSAPAPRLVVRHIRPAGVLLGLVAAALLSMSAYGISMNRWATGITPGRFPETAAGRLASIGSRSAIFNDYNDGGYLIWRLWPNWKVSMDGRVDVYGPELIRQYERTWAGAGDWETQLQSWGVTAVLGRTDIYRSFPETNLFTRLADSAKWVPVFWDSGSILYLRSDIELRDTNLLQYRRLHPGMSWKQLAARQKTAGDWKDLAADLRRAVIDDRTNVHAGRLLERLEELKLAK